jgi:hypothetical protein
MSAVDKAVEKYISLRDAKKVIADRHKEEMKPYNDAMTKIEAGVQKILIGQGGNSMKTPYGTAYLSTVTRPVIQDWKVCKQFILDNDLIDMMVQKLSPAAVEEFVESQGDLPPGVIQTSDTNCIFKR